LFEVLLDLVELAGEGLGLRHDRRLAAGQAFEGGLVALGEVGLVLGVLLEVLGLVLV
jgi:hypothetical protein